jgi:hypothetical protein
MQGIAGFFHHLASVHCQFLAMDFGVLEKQAKWRWSIFELYLKGYAFILA